MIKPIIRLATKMMNHFILALFTVKPRYLTPRYLAKLASRHVNAQDGFPAMYFDK